MARSLEELFSERAKAAGSKLIRYRSTSDLATVLEAECSLEGVGELVVTSASRVIEEAAELLDGRLVLSRPDPTIVPRGLPAEYPVVAVECSYAIAATGSIVVATDALDRLTIALARKLIVVLDDYELLGDVTELGDLLRKLTSRGMVFTLITGPSATSDVESTLVHGAHGPHSVVVAMRWV